MRAPRQRIGARLLESTSTVALIAAISLSINACQVRLKSVECTSESDCLVGFTCFQGQCLQTAEEDTRTSDQMVTDLRADGDGTDQDQVDLTVDHGPSDLAVDAVDLPEDLTDLDAETDSDDAVVEDTVEDSVTADSSIDAIIVEVTTDVPAVCSDCSAAECVLRAGFDCRAIPGRCVPEQIQIDISGSGDGLTIPFQLITDGLFVFGTNELAGSAGPAHNTSLGPFYMMSTEVTAAQFHSCVGHSAEVGGGCQVSTLDIGLDENDCTYEREGAASAPINCVNRDGAIEFCEFIGGRLPTEAEWEKAARGSCALLGNNSDCEISESFPRDNTRFPWGDQTPACNQVCANLDTCGSPARSTPCANGSDVRRSGASPYGLVDMAGNVAEWTADFWDDAIHSSGTLTNCPTVRGGTDLRVVVKGGSFLARQDVDLLSSLRTAEWPAHKEPTIGFRCVIDVDNIPLDDGGD